jgi:hypothetical protein
LGTHDGKPTRLSSGINPISHNNTDQKYKPQVAAVGAAVLVQAIAMLLQDGGCWWDGVASWRHALGSCCLLFPH